MKPKISVCLSTYNPRQDYLNRTLGGLRKQTLTHDKWEFLLIDNNSKPPLDGKVSLDGLPNARIVLEELQGLSQARRRGFQEAQGDLIVNLDDDVVLDPAYLETCLRLSVQYPFIGVFGCQREAEFEAEPIWPREHYYGAERICEKDTWSNDREHIPSTPWGAGSVVTKKVAEAYTKKMLTDPRWARLGRTADKLLSCEDVEIAMTACDLGLGKGVFRDLNIRHLIQKTKMTEEFLCKNAYGNGYSYTFHNWLRFGRLPPKPFLLGKINRSYRIFRMSPRMRRQETAKDQGIRDAVRDIKNLKPG